MKLTSAYVASELTQILEAREASIRTARTNGPTGTAELIAEMAADALAFGRLQGLIEGCVSHGVEAPL